MGIKFEKASEMTGARNIKVLVHGDSGGGKTWNSAIAALDPSRVCIFLTETQGKLQVQQSNPHATVVHGSCWADWLAFVAHMEREHKACKGKGCDDCRGTGLAGRTAFDTIVVDGFTDLQRWVKAAVERDDKRPAGNQKLREGALAQDDWAVVGVYMERAFTKLRDIDYDVVATVITNEFSDEQKRTRRIPSLQGMAARIVGQFFNVVCWLTTRPKTTGSGVDYVAVFLDPKKETVAKPSPALAAREVISDPDNHLGALMQRIKDYTPSDDEPKESK